MNFIPYLQHWISKAKFISFFLPFSHWFLATRFFHPLPSFVHSFSLPFKLFNAKIICLHSIHVFAFLKVKCNKDKDKLTGVCVCMRMCVYVYVCMCVCVYMYERGRRLGGKKEQKINKPKAHEIKSIQSG